MISIIIPCYNSEKDIEFCTRSIIEQNTNSYEIIVIDGLSKDNTIEKINQYIQIANITIISEQDQGVYDAMNKGIQLAKGEWLLFLGSDDILYNKNTLSNFVANKDERFDVIYGDVQMKYCKQRYRGETNLYQMLFEGNICHQAIFYKRSVFKIVGNYDLNYPIYADYDLNIKCWKHPKIKTKYIPEIISIYNERDGLTGNNTKDISFHKKREEERYAYRSTPKGRYEKCLIEMNHYKKKIIHKIRKYV